MKLLQIQPIAQTFYDRPWISLELRIACCLNPANSLASFTLSVMAKAFAVLPSLVPSDLWISFVLMTDKRS
jgi:hypothetical protein